LPKDEGDWVMWIFAGFVFFCGLCFYGFMKFLIWITGSKDRFPVGKKPRRPKPSSTTVSAPAAKLSEMTTYQP